MKDDQLQNVLDMLDNNDDDGAFIYTDTEFGDSDNDDDDDDDEEKEEEAETRFVSIVNYNGSNEEEITNDDENI